MISIEECKRIIKPHLSQQRYYHSKCVSKEAGRLAVLYGADEEKALVAGMLHDIMKETPDDEQLKIIDRFGIIMSNTERASRKLYHAISGAVYIQNVLNIDDSEIIDAVRWHTSGRKNMSLLEKVIFIADYISKDRDYPGVDQMRILADISLEKAMIEGIRYTVKELMDKEAFVDENTIMAYNDVISYNNI